MKRTDNKSHCPINFTLEIFGDPWSLLIVRDIVYFGKKTYGEFLGGEESIATSVLANRLVDLEKKGILVKKPHTTDKRKEVYELTEKGLDAIPIVLDMAAWGARYDPETNAPQDWIAAVNAHRGKIIALIRQTVKEGGSIFVGPNSVISKLAANL
ncbi:MAG: helix-turn-helix domain-containing protein [Patescibacteria group bacterium]